MTYGKHPEAWYVDCTSPEAIDRLATALSIVGMYGDRQYPRDCKKGTGLTAEVITLHIIFDLFEVENENDDTYPPEIEDLWNYKHIFVTTIGNGTITNLYDMGGVAMGAPGQFSSIGYHPYMPNFASATNRAALVSFGERYGATIPEDPVPDARYNTFADIPGRNMIHEIGHSFGLRHGHELDTAFGVAEEWSVMNYAYEKAVADTASFGKLNDKQRQIVSATVVNGQSDQIIADIIAASPKNTTAPPTCINGAVILAHMHCDDGTWDVLGSLTFMGKVETWYKKRGTETCGRREIPGIGAAAPGYLYPSNCDSYTKMLGWVQATYISDLAKKAQYYQDVSAFSDSRTAGKPVTSDPNYANYDVRGFNLYTQPDWLKPIPAPYLGYLHWFIPYDRQHGLTNYNTTKGYNFYGGMYGWDEGNFVLASNMGMIGKPVTDRPLLFGPYENPGGSVNASLEPKSRTSSDLAAGRKTNKVLKACWNIRDIWAVETNNAQHSSIRLIVSGNNGFGIDKFAEKVFTLEGTNYKQYCIDNVKLPYANVNYKDLEYPVFYVNRVSAITSINRTTYWPANKYTIDLPAYTELGKQLDNKTDPLITQAGFVPSTLTKGQCKLANPPTAAGCLIGKDNQISITSTIFEAPTKLSTGKKICVNGKLPAGDFFYGYGYEKNQSSPKANFELILTEMYSPASGHGLYCASTNLKAFDRLQITSSSADTTKLSTIYSVTVE